MVRSLVVLALLAGTASARPTRARIVPPSPPEPVRTWIGNDELVGGCPVDGVTLAWGAGLSVRRDVGPLELGAEGQLLRLDGDDDRHGFAARGALLVDVTALRKHRRDIDWRLSPELGIASWAMTGIGPRSAIEGFAGVRASVRALASSAGRRVSTGRGLGGHFGLRASASRDGLTMAFLVGYDWGL